MTPTCEYDEEVDAHEDDGPRHRAQPLELPVLHPEHEVAVVALVFVGRAPSHSEWHGKQFIG